MDGKALRERLRSELRESSNSEFIDVRTSYDYLWDAAIEFADRTKILQTEQSITTVADQAAYDVSPDFSMLYLTNRDRKFVVKYNDGTSNYFLPAMDYNDIFLAARVAADAVSIPHGFSIAPNPAIDSQLAGSASSVGAATGGLSTLTDSTADFSNAALSDEVHNTTDGSRGVVVGLTSDTALATALFGGTANDWTSGDSYVIQPQTRFQLHLDPPPETAGHTVTLPYLKVPAPVYSDYGVYPFPAKYHMILAKYAAWSYKYRDEAPNEGDPLFVVFDRAVKLACDALNTGLNRGRSVKVSFRADK